MPARDAAGMDFHWPAWLTHRLRVVGLLGAAIVGLAMGRGWAAPPAESSQPLLLRWIGSGHDWLLVGDRVHDRIAIYDALNGRPLAVLDHDDGLGEVESMVLEGRWLVVLGTGEPQVVRLPDLRAQPLALALR